MTLRFCTLRSWFSMFLLLFKYCKSAFFIQHCISKANGSPNGSKPHTALLSSAQCHENERWYLPCLRQRLGWFFLSPGQGVGQPEMSARGFLRTQNRVTSATEVMAGSLLRPWLPWMPFWGAGYSQYPQGYPGHSLFHTRPFPASKRVRKSSSGP